MTYRVSTWLNFARAHRQFRVYPRLYWAQAEGGLLHRAGVCAVHPDCGSLVGLILGGPRRRTRTHLPRRPYRAHHDHPEFRRAPVAAAGLLR